MTCVFFHHHHHLSLDPLTVDDAAYRGGLDQYLVGLSPPEPPSPGGPPGD